LLGIRTHAATSTPRSSSLFIYKRQKKNPTFNMFFDCLLGRHGRDRKMGSIKGREFVKSKPDINTELHLFLQNYQKKGKFWVFSGNLQFW
jgi:hypothetical protein